MKLPLIFFLAVSYIVGIALAEFLKFPLWLLVIAILFLLIILAIYFSGGLKASVTDGAVGYPYGCQVRSGNAPYTVCSGNPPYIVIPCLLFLLLGLFFATMIITKIEKGILPKIAREGQVVKLTGLVTSEPRLKAGYRGENRLSFNLNVEKIRLSQKEWRIGERVRVNIDNFQGKLKVDLGNRVAIEGKLELPESNPNSLFDYQKYLFRQRIQTILNAQPEQVRIIDQTTNPLIAVANLIRRRIKENVYRSLKGDRAGLMLGILIGETTNISEDLQDDFQTTGLTHILAVSGLNVGMLLLICLAFLRLLRIKSFFQCFFTALAIVLYALVTRGEPSVLRASIMALTGLGAWLLGREKDLIAAICFAALALLIYDPFHLYHIGFQLSFAATLAIILFNPILEKRLEGLPRRLRNDLSVCLAAQLGVTPILVYYFNQISLISILANILVVPANAPVLALGIISTGTSLISTTLSHLANLIVGLPLSYIIKVTQLLAALPMAALQLARPSLPKIALYYFLLAGTIFKLSKPRKPGSNFKVSMIILALAVAFVWWRVAQSLPPNQLRTIFFDLGQADSALIQTPDGENLLIDGGEDPTGLRSKLIKRGPSKIDLIILSHPHADHVGGLTEVIKSYKVGLVLDGGQPHPSPLYEKFLKAVKLRKIPYRLARRGQRFQIGLLRVEILHPSDNFITGTTSDVNNNSVVAKIIYGKVSFLFAGDIEEAGEQSLLVYGDRLKANILKVPHHGSANGGNFAFLRTVQPDLAIISAGKDNPFGHPARSTIGKLRSLGARIYRTDENGDIVVESDGKRLKVKTER